MTRDTLAVVKLERNVCILSLFLEPVRLGLTGRARVTADLNATAANDRDSLSLDESATFVDTLIP